MPKPEGEFNGKLEQEENVEVVGLEPGKPKIMRVVGQPTTKVVARIGKFVMTETSYHLEPVKPAQDETGK